MQNRTTAVILTIVAILLCGCPGLAAMCLGFSSLAVQAGDFYVFSTDPVTNNIAIFSMICVGIIMALITVVVGFFLLRRKKEPLPPPPPTLPDEPLPPTI